MGLSLQGSLSDSWAWMFQPNAFRHNDQHVVNGRVIYDRPTNDCSSDDCPTNDCSACNRPTHDCSACNRPTHDCGMPLHLLVPPPL